MLRPRVFFNIPHPQAISTSFTGSILQVLLKIVPKGGLGEEGRREKEASRRGLHLVKVETGVVSCR